MTLTIEDLLHLPELNHAVLKGGVLGKSRTINSVNVMDAPDIGEWVKPHQLILTTAYVIKDDMKAQIELIRELNRKQCSGLAIKTRRFLSELPQELICAADRLNFPLIELSPEISLGDIMNSILSYVLNNKQMELEKTFEIHKRFNHLFLKGAKLSTIAQTLSLFIQCPVAILNPALSLAGSSSNFHFKKNTQSLLPLVRQWILSEPLAANRLHCTVLEDKKIGIYPIYNADILRGYILLLIDKIPDIMPIEQAANVVSYQMIKQEALEEGKRRMRLQFYYEFLEKKIRSVDDLRQKARMYGLNNDSYWVSVAHVEITDTVSGVKKQQILEQYVQQIQSYFQCNDPELIAITKEDHLVLMLPKYEKMKEEHEVIEALQKLQGWLNEHGEGVSCSFGLGNIAEALEHIPDSYQQALQALEHGHRSYPKPFLASFRTQEVSELLRLIPRNKLLEFYRHTLKAIVSSKEGEHAELIQTLKTYLGLNCQITQTAKQLYIHRNTVLYRVQKCAELLGVDFKDPIDNLKIRLALEIHPFAQEAERLK